MSPFVQLVTDVLSILTVVGDVLIIFLIFVLSARKLGMQSSFIDAPINFFGNNALLFSFLVALVSMASSLFYSEIARFVPCLLCWWQRIFLFPQVFILGLALWKKNKNIGAYSILLSIIGGVFAAYHSYLQFGGSPLVPCSANGIAASCTQRYFLEFSYVSIPTMALTGFIMIIIFLAAGKIDKNSLR